MIQTFTLCPGDDEHVRARSFLYFNFRDRLEKLSKPSKSVVPFIEFDSNLLQSID